MYELFKSHVSNTLSVLLSDICDVGMPGRFVRHPKRELKQRRIPAVFPISLE